MGTHKLSLPTEVVQREESNDRSSVESQDNYSERREADRTYWRTLPRKKKAKRTLYDAPSYGD